MVSILAKKKTKVKSHQRKTPSGKTTKVKAHERKITERKKLTKEEIEKIREMIELDDNLYLIEMPEYHTSSVEEEAERIVKIMNDGEDFRIHDFKVVSDDETLKKKIIELWKEANLNDTSVFDKIQDNVYEMENDILFDSIGELLDEGLIKMKEDSD
jgi:hypothetical protein